jgi:hypothetical protein
VVAASAARAGVVNTGAALISATNNVAKSSTNKIRVFIQFLLPFPVFVFVLFMFTAKNAC